MKSQHCNLYSVRFKIICFENLFIWNANEHFSWCMETVHALYTVNWDSWSLSNFGPKLGKLKTKLIRLNSPLSSIWVKWAKIRVGSTSFFVFFELVNRNFSFKSSQSRHVISGSRLSSLVFCFCTYILLKSFPVISYQQEIPRGVYQLTWSR